MIDYFFRWANETEARIDALALAEFLSLDLGFGRHWLQGHVLPNIQVWRPSQDVGGIHSYLTGWFAVVATAQPRDLLLNASALAFALNRNGPPYVLKNNIGAIITDVACSPIFAGSHYPIGGYSS